MVKAGRPKWMPPDVAKVEAIAARGLTEKEISYVLGISQETLIQRKKEYAEFSEAIKRGQARGHMEISNALYEKAKSGDTGAQAFYLKCRAGWKEVNKLEHSGVDGEAIKHEVKLSPASEALARLADKISQKRGLK